MDSARDMLDQLFGKNRNLTTQEQKKKQELYSDDFVCKNTLISRCFNDMFPKTGLDQGECTKRHDPIFKKQFEDDESYKRYKNEKKYITNALSYIEGMVKEVDDKIKSKQQNLEINLQQEVELPKEVQERISLLDDEVRSLLALSQKMGEEGNIEESEFKANEAEMKTKQIEEIKKQNEAMISGINNQQVVCDVCGAYQTGPEQDKRRLIHLEGKIHQGFKFFREEIVRLKERRDVVKQKEDELKKIEDDRRSRSRDRKHSKKSKKHKKHHKRRHSSSSPSSDRDRKKKKRKSKRHYSSSRSRSR